MEEDLTASHWDDVLSPSSGAQNASGFHLHSGYMDIEDPHRESINILNDDPLGDPSDLSLGAPSDQEHPLGFGQANHQAAEIEQLDEIRRQEIDTHKSNLLMELTSGADDPLINELPPLTKKAALSDLLFQDKDSMSGLLSPQKQDSAPSNSTVKSSQLKNGKFKGPRNRKFSLKTVIKHLGGKVCPEDDPLNDKHSEPLQAPENAPEADSRSPNLIEEADSPLYDLKSHAEENGKGLEKLEQMAPLLPELNKHVEDADGNALEITVEDPVKVGDITNAHIAYGIKVRNHNTQSSHFPERDENIAVSRRYKDFRWIYHQLQSNHPGKIIPPPPSKQTYIGRFNENFIENRRLSLEKMLTKISKVPALANDPDFVMFLVSDNFVNDAKEREQISGSSASIEADGGNDDAPERHSLSTPATLTGTSGGGFMSSFFSIPIKITEPDAYFSKKKGYIEDLEHNLRTFYKSLEMIATQRLETSSVINEIAKTVEDLADLEILKTTSDLLAAFAEVQTKLKENLDRVNLQDQLTFGFTIEEYLRIIGSVKHTFETRMKIYQQFQNASQELSKKEDSLERLNSKHKSAVDKINMLTFEIDKLKQKVRYFEDRFNTVSDTIKKEMDNFEMEKIEDFRNSVEIYIEGSIESQKESIELWETFYERQKLELV